jgi:hypothetical protein
MNESNLPELHDRDQDDFVDQPEEVYDGDGTEDIDNIVAEDNVDFDEYDELDFDPDRLEIESHQDIPEVEE